MERVEKWRGRRNEEGGEMEREEKWRGRRNGEGERESCMLAGNVSWLIHGFRCHLRVSNAIGVRVKMTHH